MSESAVVSCGFPKEGLSERSSGHEPAQSAQKHSDNCGFPKDKIPGPLSGHEPVYHLDDPKLEKDLRFFQHSTGIQDTSLLRSHILKIRDEAFKCFPYPCIWALEFLKGKSIVHPFYSEIKKKQPMQASQQIIMVDFGCFMGVDSRQVVNDGWKLDNILGVDIHEEWHNLGLQLFNDADRPPPFFKGDIFNPTIFDASTPGDANNSVIDLRALKDLNQLKGRANFISAHQLFHLFSENDQRELAKRLALLLSDEPGSGIFGSHLGLPEPNFEPYALFLHSPKSWEKLWKEILGEGKCQVKAELEEFDANHRYRSYPGVNRLYWLHWSVVRI